MEFHNKLQELRRQRGLTQEELARSLYVSRTAVSKWESGRGYPSIDSLKAIADFFSVTVDQLLSTNEAIAAAEEDHRQRERRICDLSLGLLDLASVMLLFLPFFATEAEGVIQSVSLLSMVGARSYLRIAYLAVTVGLSLLGILTLTLQNFQGRAWLKSKTPLSVLMGTAQVLLFMISKQPYAAVFAFSLLLIKLCILLKIRKHP